MRSIVLIALGLTLLPLLATAKGAERRCGWYANPTPGNLMLRDKDGDWWIQMQGKPDPDGIDNAPAFDEKQFVETNVPGYGYGCACMTVTTDGRQKKITRIITGEIIPLRRCHNDRSLPRPE